MFRKESLHDSLRSAHVTNRTIEYSKTGAIEFDTYGNLRGSGRLACAG